MSDVQRITWMCYRCGAAGIVVQQPDDSLELVEAAIRTGHERKDATCHARRGIAKVKASLDGKTITFSTNNEHS
jgi:hypothetical protein